MRFNEDQLSEQTIDLLSNHTITISRSKNPDINSKVSRNSNYKLLTFINKLASECQSTGMTREEFNQLDKNKKFEVKGKRWFQSGPIGDTPRLPTARSMIAIDIDNATKLSPEVINEHLKNYLYILFPSISHSEQSPRYRLLIPLQEEIKPDHATALSVLIAKILGYTWKLDDDSIDINASTLPKSVMYWPMDCTDDDWEVIANDGRILDGMGYIDAMWENVIGGSFEDQSTWPQRERKSGGGGGNRTGGTTPDDLAEDPRTKRGYIASFCRVYDIPSAVKKFMPDIWEPAFEDQKHQRNTRLTYLKGTGFGGGVMYTFDRDIKNVDDDFVFVYSHHATDPYCEQILNAWDFVRLHKFGHLDKGSKAKKTSTLPSQEAMINFVANNDEIKISMQNDAMKGMEDTNFNDEKNKSASPESKNINSDKKEKSKTSDDSSKDHKTKDKTENEKEFSYLDNIKFKSERVFVGKDGQGNLIINYLNCYASKKIRDLKPNKDTPPYPMTFNRDGFLDANHQQNVDNWVGQILRDVLWYNTRSDKVVYRKYNNFILSSLIAINKAEDVNQRIQGVDVDLQLLVMGLVTHCSNYGNFYPMNVRKPMIEDSVTKISKIQKYDPLTEYLDNRPPWDGKQRVKKLLSKCILGVEKSEYTEQVAKYFMLSCVGRAYIPGLLVDRSLVFYGTEGTGKSSTFKALCPIDSLHHDDVNMSTSKESIESTQGVWIAEFSELNSLKAKKIKQFMSATVDKARAAYAANVTDKARSFVVYGTTNDTDWLTKEMSMRRWLPVKVKSEMGGTEKEKALAEARKWIYRNRSQLWAEALHLWNTEGELPAITGDAKKILDDELRASENHDINDEEIESIVGWIESDQGLADRHIMCTKLIFYRMFNRNPQDIGKADNERSLLIKRALREAGYRSEGYVKNSALPQAPLEVKGGLGAAPNWCGKYRLFTKAAQVEL